MLDAIYEPFDLIPILVQLEANLPLLQAVFLRRDDSLRFQGGDVFQQIVRIVAFISKNGPNPGRPRSQQNVLQQGLCLWRISGLTGRERNF